MTKESGQDSVSLPRKSKMSRGWRRAGMALALIAIALIVIEVGSFVVLRLMMLRARTIPKEEASLPFYKEVPWGAAYWREHARFLESWFETYPYGLWRQRPFTGEFTNNNERGERRTHNSDCSGDAPTIYVYGGSTVWGQGSPDWQTIPSELAKRFADDGRVVCVVNRGSDAWSSNESLIDLILELKQPDRRRLDYVVFLDSCNDVTTPFVLGRGIEPPYTPLTKQWLDALASMHLGSFDYLAGTNTWTLATRLVQRLKGRDSFPAPPEPDRLGRAVVDRYLQNIKMVGALSVGFGFKYDYFWLPMPATESDPPAIHAAVRTMRPLIGAANVDHLHDLSDLYGPGLRTDLCHVLPEGNRLIAGRVYDVIKSELPTTPKQ